MHFACGAWGKSCSYFAHVFILLSILRLYFPKHIEIHYKPKLVFCTEIFCLCFYFVPEELLIKCKDYDGKIFIITFTYRKFNGIIDYHMFEKEKL